jgi:hypothetical protein
MWGGDSKTKLVHTAVASAAHVADAAVLPKLLHGPRRGSGGPRLSGLQPGQPEKAIFFTAVYQSLNRPRWDALFETSLDQTFARVPEGSSDLLRSPLKKPYAPM